MDLPNSKDKLFTDDKDYWHLNACISSFDKTAAYSIGYLKAAQLISRIVIYSGQQPDTLLYPIVYLYRHYLEIMLKDLISDGLEIRGETVSSELKEILGQHNLMKLWNNFKPFFCEVCGTDSDFEAVKKAMESYINQMHCIDPEAISFRYDKSKTGKQSLEGIERINILNFCRNMEKLSLLIEGISMQFSDALDHVRDMRRSMY